MKERISDLLMNTLSYAYCDNCDNNETENCEYCHRKSQCWCLARHIADDLAEKILSICTSTAEQRGESYAEISERNL